MISSDLRGVIESSMCIGCGVCEVVDPSITLVLDPSKQIWQPDGPGGQDAAGVCPAVQVDYAGLHDYLFPGAKVGPYGVVDAVFLAQSTNHDRNVKASSGGLIKEVLRHLLVSGRIDGAIALDHVDGIEFAARLITDPDDVDNLPGSIYHNLKQRSALDLIIENEGQFALVAIPCQLEGIYAYIQRHAPELRERVAITIGLLCGWQYSHHSINAMGEFIGFDPTRIADISFRGGGPVGKLTVTTDDGAVHTASRRVDFSYQVAFDRHFNTPRCHVCVNHSNFLADLVVGDAWLPSTVFTKTGISLVTTRTAEATTLVEELAVAGTCVVEHVGTEEIRESQTDRVVFGEFAYAYADYLTEIGAHVPKLVGPNIDAGGRKPRRQVEKFHRELVRKQSLMRQRRYRLLKWRKATLELPQFLSRYVRWFLVRIVRVKSIGGTRTEVPRSQLSRFK
jgi:coenzyme F420-reducing hydrogenase beta subunit